MLCIDVLPILGWVYVRVHVHNVEKGSGAIVVSLSFSCHTFFLFPLSYFLASFPWSSPRIMLLLVWDAKVQAYVEF